MTLLQSINLNLSDKLREKEYRSVFFEEWAKDEFADQIRRIRKLRGLRQIDVAHKAGMKQSAISRIEQSTYTKWNFTTLLRICDALDARIRVTVEPAEDVIRQYESVAAYLNAEGPSAVEQRQTNIQIKEDEHRHHHDRQSLRKDLRHSDRRQQPARPLPAADNLTPLSFT